MKIWNGESLTDGEHYFETALILESRCENYEYGYEYIADDSSTCALELFDNVDEAKASFNAFKLCDFYIEDFKTDGLNASKSWYTKVVTEYECVNGALQEVDDSTVCVDSYGFTELLYDEMAVRNLIPDAVKDIFAQHGFDVASVSADGSGYVRFNVEGETDNGLKISHRFELDMKDVLSLQEWGSCASHVWCAFDRADEVCRAFDFEEVEPGSYLYDLVETDINDYENGSFRQLCDSLIALGREVSRKDIATLSENAKALAADSLPTEHNVIEKDSYYERD